MHADGYHGDVPESGPLGAVVDWIVQRATPEHVPAALRCARSRHRTEAGLETPAETRTRIALDEFERCYLDDMARFQDELESAQEEAEPVRSGLLYGSGSARVDAVAVVLRAAGFTVTDLDAEMGAIVSAYLLVAADRATC